MSRFTKGHRVRCVRPERYGRGDDIYATVIEMNPLNASEDHMRINPDYPYAGAVNGTIVFTKYWSLLGTNGTIENNEDFEEEWL